MATTSTRRGHAAIGAIISDMQPYLPPDTVDRPGYKHCRTTYGLLTTTHQRASHSSTPGKPYRELQQLESELRRRLDGLNATKGVPARMTDLLNELKAALDDAVAQGVDAEFLAQGVADLLLQEERPETRSALGPDRVRMVPDTKYKNVVAELQEAKARIQRLNEENNALAMRVKKLEALRTSEGAAAKGSYDDCEGRSLEWVAAAFKT